MVIFRCLPASDGTETEHEAFVDRLPAAAAPASFTVPSVELPPVLRTPRLRWPRATGKDVRHAPASPG